MCAKRILSSAITRDTYVKWLSVVVRISIIKLKTLLC